MLAEWQGKNKVYRLNPDMFQILSGIERHLARYAPALDSCCVLEAESKPLIIAPVQTGRSGQRLPRNGKPKR